MTPETLLGLVQAAMEVPRQAWAPVLGLLSSWALTQRLKFLLPSAWSAKARDVATQAIAFAVALPITAITWGVDNAMGWVAALVVGLIAPAAWSVFVLAIGWWKPELRDRLSKDTST